MTCAAIVGQAGHTISAAKFCRDLVAGGCDDWYLPSVNEFFAIATNAAVLGISNELGRGYWTSSEYPYSSPVCD